MVQYRKKKSQISFLDPSLLPMNLFSLRGDAFYELLMRITSEDIKELLKIQRISMANCFLDTDPLAFFDLNCSDPSITEIQSRLSFKTESGDNVIFAGIEADLRYLRRLFETFFTTRNAKKPKGQIDPNTNLASPQPNSPMGATPLAIPVESPQPSNLSAIDHHDYLTKQIDSWWETRRNDFNLEHSLLIETDDYQLIIKNDSVSVKCSCKRNISLTRPMDRLHYQLSNFYKHLTQSTRCTVISKKKMPLEPAREDDSESISSSSTRSASPDKHVTPKKRKNVDPSHSIKASSRAASKRQRI